MAGPSILINVGAKTASAVSGLSDVEKALKRQDDATKKASGGWKKMAGVLGGIAAGAAVGDYLLDAAKAAAADAAETSKLNKILDNNTTATQSQIDAASAWIDQMEIATTTSDTQLRASLEKLTAQTGDLGSAQEATALAVDVAAGKNISLSASTKIVEKALAGQTKALQKQHPEWDTNHDKILSSEEAMKGLGDSYSGAAEAAADPWTQIQTIFGQLKEQIGGFVLPLLDKVKTWLNNPGNVAELQATLGDIGDKAKEMGDKIAGAIGWLIDNQGTIKTVAIALGVLAAAMGVIAIAQGIWTVVTGIWTAVTAVATAVGTAFSAVVLAMTSPVFFIVAAIIALIAIVVLLWKNWDKVTKALGKAWDWLKSKAIAIFNAIKTFLAGVWNAIRSAVMSVWNGIKSFLSGAWTAIKNTATSAFNALKSKISEIFNGIKTSVRDKIGDLVALAKGIPGKIKNAIGNVGSLLYNVGRDLIQGLINGIKSLLGGIGGLIKGLLPSWLPGVNSASVSAAGVGVLGASTPGGTSIGSITFNLVGDPTGNERAIKRALESHDIRMGRRPGAVLKRAW